MRLNQGSQKWLVLTVVGFLVCDWTQPAKSFVAAMFPAGGRQAGFSTLRTGKNSHRSAAVPWNLTIVSSWQDSIALFDSSSNCKVRNFRRSHRISRNIKANLAHTVRCSLAEFDTAYTTMSFTEINNGITPSFVSLALSGITHRFILVVECESRQSTDGSPDINHPRFCVGGARATLDPRNVSLTELLPLASSKVDLPPGWEKVHQLVYGTWAGVGGQ